MLPVAHTYSVRIGQPHGIALAQSDQGYVIMHNCCRWSVHAARPRRRALSILHLQEGASLLRKRGRTRAVPGSNAPDSAWRRTIGRPDVPPLHTFRFQRPVLPPPALILAPPLLVRPASVLAGASSLRGAPLVVLVGADERCRLRQGCIAPKAEGADALIDCDAGGYLWRQSHY